MSNQPRVSFLRKEPFTCPVCKTKHRHEEMLSGRGRLVAEGLSVELRRYYRPTEKYGRVRPLIYSVATCPKCLFSTMPSDFIKPINDKELFQTLVQTTADRVNFVREFFPTCSFYTEFRGIQEGIVSYMLAFQCYQLLPVSYSPSFNTGRAALRCAWLLEDLVNHELEDKNEIQKYLKMQDQYYQNAARFYELTLEREQKGEEPLMHTGTLGPDTDKDFGYDGVKYLYSLLNYRMCFFENDIPKRIKKFAGARALVGKMFGFGDISKEKPSVLLDMARVVHKLISQKIKEYQDRLDAGETDFETRLEIDVVPDHKLSEDLRFSAH